MHKHGPLLATTGLLLCMMGCGSPEPAAAPTMRRPDYFPLKAYLDAQAARLNQLRPAVAKQVMLRNSQPETTRVPQVDWTKELQIFYQADINKPALRGAYTVDSSTANGVRHYTYTRRPEVENPVTRLQIDTDAAGVRTVSATLTQDNPLFFSEKKMVLQAQNGRLRSYQVRGVQKLILFDTLRYSTAAQVQ